MSNIHTSPPPPSPLVGPQAPLAGPQAPLASSHSSRAGSQTPQAGPQTPLAGPRPFWQALNPQWMGGRTDVRTYGISTRHYVPPLALFFHERRKVYVQYMFVDYVLNHHNAYLSNLLTAQVIQSDYLRVTCSLKKIHKCFLV